MARKRRLTKKILGNLSDGELRAVLQASGKEMREIVALGRKDLVDTVYSDPEIFTGVNPVEMYGDDSARLRFRQGTLWWVLQVQKHLRGDEVDIDYPPTKTFEGMNLGKVEVVTETRASEPVVEAPGSGGSSGLSVIIEEAEKLLDAGGGGRHQSDEVPSMAECPPEPETVRETLERNRESYAAVGFKRKSERAQEQEPESGPEHNTASEDSQPLQVRYHEDGEVGETTARPRQETRLDEIDEEITRCFETIVSLRKEARDLRTSQSRA